MSYIDQMKSEGTTYDISARQLSDGANTIAYAKVDGLLKVDTVTFTAAGWVGDSAPFTQTVNLSRITSTDQPVISLFYPAGQTSAEVEAYEEAYGHITVVESGTGTLTATCKLEKPLVDVQVLVKGI